VSLTKDDQTVENRQTPTTAEYKPLLKRFALRLCVAVTLGVILLTSVELYSYRRYRRTGSDVLDPGVKLDLAETGSTAQRDYWKEFEQANKVVYHQYVLWRRAPYSGELISIDRDGVRRTFHTRCDDKTFTIWMFGDSVMWGAGTPDAETIPSLVARDYEKAGKPVCIVNFGEKGWSSTQEMVGLIELLKHAARKPDIVFFYDGGSEAYAAYQSGQADVHTNFDMFKNFLDNWGSTQKASFSYLRQTNTYRLLEKLALKMPFHRQPAKIQASTLDTEALSAAIVDNYVQNMDIVSLLAKQYGFRPIFAWYPNLAVGHKELTSYEQQVLRFQYDEFPHLGAMYQAVYNKGREIWRPDFYYLGDMMDDQKSSLYVGISHMKSEGDQIVAERIFDILQGKSSNLAASPPSGLNVRDK
jgi:hypothetical protein